MSDHWNSLANLLGTPSVDPLPRKPNPAANPESKKSATSSENSSVAHDRPDSQAAAESAPRPLLDPAISPVAKPEQPSRLRSSWDTVARLFGVVTGTETAPETQRPTPPVVQPQRSLPQTPDEDLFAGFSRKPDQVIEEEPRHNRSSQDSRVQKSPPRDSISKPKKRPSLFDGPEVMNEPSSPVKNEESPATHSRSSSKSRTVSDESSDGIVSERSGRKRNIRRGQSSERTNRERGSRREPDPIPEENVWEANEVDSTNDVDRITRENRPARPEKNVADDSLAPRRKRRRGSRRDSKVERDPSDASQIGERQAYGRKSEDQEDEEGNREANENVRILKVTSWLDAITPMIESNMENHKRNTNTNTNRGRGQSRSGPSRRRGNSGGNR